LCSGASIKAGFTKEDINDSKPGQKVNQKVQKRKIKKKDEKKVGKGELDEIFARLRKKKKEQKKRNTSTIGDQGEAFIKKN